MEIIYLIIGIYWVIAVIIEFLKHDTIFTDTYKSFKDYKMPLYAAFWFLLVVGFALFAPFTFPKTLWRGAKNNIKFRKQINKQKREKKEEAKRKADPMLMAQRVIDNLKKYSTESVVWPVISIEGNKSQIWNELNKINEYVFLYIAREKAQIQKLKTEIEELKNTVYDRDVQIEGILKPISDLPKPKHTAFERVFIGSQSEFIKKEQEKPIHQVFDSRTCNLIKKYEQTYGVKFMLVKDLAKMSHYRLKLLRGVGPDTLNNIERKLLKRQIKMKA